MKKKTAVMPAYNEAGSIERMVRQCLKYVDEVIVVDDSSSDSTAVLAEKAGAVVLRHRKNRGYERSLDHGIKEAFRRKAFAAVTLDADGQHNPPDLARVLRPIIDDRADVVSGKRPRKARLAESIFALYSRLKLGVPDPLCGMKAYSRKVYKSIGYFDRLNSVGTELMFRAHDEGFRIVSVPITINKRKGRPRYGGALKANLKILKGMMKVMMR